MYCTESKQQTATTKQKPTTIFLEKKSKPRPPKQNKIAPSKTGRGRKGKGRTKREKEKKRTKKNKKTKNKKQKTPNYTNARVPTLPPEQGYTNRY